MRELAVIVDFNLGVEVVVELETFQSQDEVGWRFFQGLGLLGPYFFVTLLAEVFVFSIQDLGMG